VVFINEYHFPAGLVFCSPGPVKKAPRCHIVRFSPQDGLLASLSRRFR